MEAIKVNAPMARSCMIKGFQAGLVPLILGQPGGGKSDITKSIAEEFNLKLIDVRAAQCDPTDFNGFPQVVDGRSSYLPFDTFPLQGDTVPEGYAGWLLFLDEITSADRGVQKALYKLVLDRQVGNHFLHESCFIIGAGNRMDDAAIVEEFSSALVSRVTFLELLIDPEAWLLWAASNKIDYRICGFIKTFPHMLNTFKPENMTGGADSYACPRTVAKVSDILRQCQVQDQETIPLLAGTCGEGWAREFIAYTERYHEIPAFEDIVKTPDTIGLPADDGLIFALTSSLAHNTKPANIDPVMKFTSRLPLEYQVITMRDMSRRTPELLQSEPVSKWLVKNASRLAA